MARAGNVESIDIPSFFLSIPSAIFALSMFSIGIFASRPRVQMAEKRRLVDNKIWGRRALLRERAPIGRIFSSWSSHSRLVQDSFDLRQATLASYTQATRPRELAKMLLEDTRGIHEDLERLEAAIADRVAEEPRNVSTRQPQAARIPANVSRSASASIATTKSQSSSCG